MWYEAIPSMIAMGIGLTIIEAGPFITHYLTWGCPMMRGPTNEVSKQLTRRDGRISQEIHGYNYGVKHMYTFGLNGVKKPYKKSGNYSHYAQREKELLEKQIN